MDIVTGEVAVAFYYLALGTVLVLAAAKGGRFERGMALTIGVASVATLLSQFLLKQLVAIVPFTIIDVIVLISIVHICRYHRRIWTYSAAVLQCISLVVDFCYMVDAEIPRRFYMALLNTIYYGILSSIVFGVLRRRLGPPHALPQSPLKDSPLSVSPSPLDSFWLHQR